MTAAKTPKPNKTKKDSTLEHLSLHPCTHDPLLPLFVLVRMPSVHWTVPSMFRVGSPSHRPANSGTSSETHQEVSYQFSRSLNPVKLTRINPHSQEFRSLIVQTNLCLRPWKPTFLSKSSSGINPGTRVVLKLLMKLCNWGKAGPLLRQIRGKWGGVKHC
jgi:hypothetical protein